MTLAALSLVLAAAVWIAAWQARRLGNEARDRRLLAVIAGVLGAGSLASVLA